MPKCESTPSGIRQTHRPRMTRASQRNLTAPRSLFACLLTHEGVCLKRALSTTAAQRHKEQHPLCLCAAVVKCCLQFEHGSKSISDKRKSHARKWYVYLRRPCASCLNDVFPSGPGALADYTPLTYSS